MDLDDVLQSSMSLKAQSLSRRGGTRTTSDIPGLERSLQRIDKETERLVPSYASGTPRRHADQAARRLLAAHGLEEEKLFRNLRGITLIDTVPVLEDGKAAPVTSQRRISTSVEMQEFLDRGRELAMETAVAQSTQQTLTMFRAAAYSSIHSDTRWANEELCRRISKRTGPSRPRSKVPERPTRSLSGRKRHAQLRCGYSDQDLGVVVKCFLESGSSDSIAEELYRAAQKRRLRLSRLDEGHILACYAALRFITCEDVESEVTMTGIIAGARQSLEASFIDQVLSQCDSALGVDFMDLEALMARIQSLVQSYVRDGRIPVNLTTSSAELLSGLPLWPQVYYAFRAGSVIAVANILQDAKEDVWTHMDPRGMDGLSFYKYFNSWRENQYFLGDIELREIVDQYKINVQRSDDPYRRACYMLIMRLNPEDELAFPESDDQILYNSLEDYCWMRLHCVRLLKPHPSVPSDLADCALTLATLQNQLRHFGRKYFDPSGLEPAKYAFVLLISGQFSQAIECLAEAGNSVDHHYREDAIHLGIALAAHSMLPSNVHPTVSPAVSSIDGGMCDFESLLWDYISDFGGRVVGDAALYIFLVSDSKIRHSLIQKLSESSGEYEVLFGSPSDGGRVGGLVDHLTVVVGGSQNSEEWRDLLIGEARRLEKCGDDETALQLYELVRGQEDQSMSILNRRLSGVIDRRDSPARELAVLRAKEFLQAQGIADSVNAEPTRVRDTLVALLRLASIYDYWWHGQLREAFDELVKLELLPLQPNDEGDAVLASYNVIKSSGGSGEPYTADLLSRVPEIVSLAVDILLKIYCELVERLDRFTNSSSRPREGSSGGGLTSVTSGTLGPAAGPAGSAAGSAAGSGLVHGDAGGIRDRLEQIQVCCRSVINLAGMLRLGGGELNAKLMELDSILT